MEVQRGYVNLFVAIDKKWLDVAPVDGRIFEPRSVIFSPSKALANEQVPIDRRGFASMGARQRMMGEILEDVDEGTLGRRRSIGALSSVGVWTIFISQSSIAARPQSSTGAFFGRRL